MEPSTCDPLVAGNHALALAYHGTQLGIAVNCFMPAVAPLTKVRSNAIMNFPIVEADVRGPRFRLPSVRSY